MQKEILAESIKEKAIQLGFEGCGIIPIDEMREYEEKLNQRIEACPASKPMLEPLRKYAKLYETYDWSKSVIVCVTSYNQYQFPDEMKGLIGKYYLYDHKLQPEAKMNKSIVDFEKYIEGFGIKIAKELHGVTSGRLAAQKAGLGLIRKNNFLYTQSGSRVIIDTWVIDYALELKEKTQLKACPQDCNQCMSACPTQALSSPYCTDMATCITRLTWGVRDLPDEGLREKMKTWIYGCDACQNACPMNKEIEQRQQEYAGLDALTKEISLENIFVMDEAQLKQIMAPKFWFITPENFWLWKVNVLRAMANSYKEEYGTLIRLAAASENEKIRKMANWAAEQVGLEIGMLNE